MIDCFILKLDICGLYYCILTFCFALFLFFCFLNAAPFAIVSFPFLFSLMFGDAGHGLLMLAAAVWMVASERRLIRNKSDSEVYYCRVFVCSWRV